MQWYENARPQYVALSETIATTLTALLRAKKIDFVDIPYLAKTAEGFYEELRRKRYRNPTEEMMDLAGIPRQARAIQFRARA
jgi:hypothetical protein